MNSDKNLLRIRSHPSAIALAADLLCLVQTEESPERILALALPLLRDASQSGYAALARGERGKWRIETASGSTRELPLDLLADVLDQEAARGQGEWFAAPLDMQAHPGEVLVLHKPQAKGTPSEKLADALAALLAAALADVRNRGRYLRRVERLEAILAIAGQWNQAQEMDALLTSMAEVSTRLLAAERASIFLWDRRNKMLVGRPALGVEGGELRIPDDKGIVGQVVQTGQPRRVDADAATDQSEINRGVDKMLGFQTRSLLCVPLRAGRGGLLGAFEMINKKSGNFNDDDEAALTELAAHASIALENTQQYEQLLKARNQMADRAAEKVQLLGECPAIEALRGTIRRVADTDLTILILGENGTGKEVVSQMVHYLSRRRNEPFLAVNCAALTETLLESELFGHEKGAFTDARETRAGKFELASGGTLFLDEIGDMSPGGQAKLLRVLEEKVVVRVGGSVPIHTDARVVAATNQNLAQMVRQKKFREDLYFRLNVVTLDLPPLRERGDDVFLLAEMFLRDFCTKARRKAPKFTAAARKRLLGHPWPGNVRELRNLMERLAYLSQDDKIDAEDLSFILSPGGDALAQFSLDLPLAEATKNFQSQYIQKHIQATRGNMTDAAARLGLHRSNLYRKMRQLEMPVDEAEEE
jgi:transcriptional regulator with GAF, ATPase, and Fis domain